MASHPCDPLRFDEVLQRKEVDRNIGARVEEDELLSEVENLKAFDQLSSPPAACPA